MEKKNLENVSDDQIIMLESYVKKLMDRGLYDEARTMAINILEYLKLKENEGKILKK